MALVLCVHSGEKQGGQQLGPFGLHCCVNTDIIFLYRSALFLPLETPRVPELPPGEVSAGMEGGEQGLPC